MLNINYTNHWNGEKINSTIQQSIIDTFGKLRYQAKDDPKAFKDILKIIILDDIIEWSNSASGMQSDLKKMQQKLRDLQTQFILCNPAFSKQYIDSELAYVNVNTPQSNSTWKRVWDSESCVNADIQLPPICQDDECDQQKKPIQIRLGQVKDLIIRIK